MHIPFLDKTLVAFSNFVLWGRSKSNEVGWGGVGGSSHICNDLWSMCRDRKELRVFFYRFTYCKSSKQFFFSFIILVLKTNLLVE